MSQVSADDLDRTRYGDAGRVRACGLTVAPFRGLRYDPERISSLGAVTSPPYDVVAPDDQLRLEDADPHNIVRLILPRPEPTAEDGYRHAAQLLRTWQQQGVLRPDPQPALYVYEQTHDGTVQRGLIGALAVSDPGAGIVLPHEDVMPRPVADRVGLMRTTKANLEPLLLTYRGDGRAADVIDDAATTAPLLTTVTSDGTRHRLWAVTDPTRLAAVSGDLATCRALIADGHHRWAMYLRLQREHRYLAHSPWDWGMVLLVDTARYPLQVRAIHRVLRRLPLDRAVDQLGPDWTASDHPGPLPEALKALAAAKEEGRNAFLLADDNRQILLTTHQTRLLPATATDLPDEYLRLDATVLHSLLLDRVWHVPDDPEHIAYLHDVDAAVREAGRSGGTAVLLHPVEEGVVRRLAEQGVTMPRKSTSFGPKPASGLVLRSLLLD